MISVLALGFLLGIRHAFEADHLAAVSTLVSRGRDLRDMTRHGALWGVGHTLALLAISLGVLFTPWGLPESFGPALELVVGLLLVGLGLHVLYRLWRDRVHIHVHSHADGEIHLHAHSHRHEQGPHAESAHDHHHPLPRWRTLLVGLTHGAAGSAALTVYLAASLESPWVGLIYVLLFGVGSILGMGALSAVIAWPITATAKRLTWAHRGLQAAVAVASIAIGLSLAVEQGWHLWR